MIQMRTITPREKTLATCVAVVVLAGIFLNYAAVPIARRWLEANHRAQEAVNELAELRALVVKRESIETEYAALQGLLTSGRTAEEHQVALLREVEELARSCGLLVSVVRPVAPRNEGRLTRLGVHVNARGESDGLVRFLGEAQNPGHLLRIERLTLTVGRTRPTLTLALVISKLAAAEGVT
jgi:hypothetical protein